MMRQKLVSVITVVLFVACGLTGGAIRQEAPEYGRRKARGSSSAATWRRRARSMQSSFKWLAGLTQGS
jgi:hypothetical protein